MKLPIGGYLQPEPLLSNPVVVMLAAMRASTVPAYSYALNNPVALTDPTGLSPYCDRNAHQCGRNGELLAEQKCECENGGGVFTIQHADAKPENPAPDNWDGGSYPDRDIVGGVCTPGKDSNDNVCWSQPRWTSLPTDDDHYNFWVGQKPCKK